MGEFGIKCAVAGYATTKGSCIRRRAKSLQPIDQRTLRLHRHQKIDGMRPNGVTYSLGLQLFVGDVSSRATKNAIIPALNRRELSHSNRHSIETGSAIFVIESLGNSFLSWRYVLNQKWCDAPVTSLGQ